MRGSVLLCVIESCSLYSRSDLLYYFTRSFTLDSFSLTRVRTRRFLCPYFWFQTIASRSYDSPSLPHLFSLLSPTLR